MKQPALTSQNAAQYKNARGSLLIIVLLSAVNLISTILAEVYFLFSAYLPQIIISIGYMLSLEAPEGQGGIFIVIFAVLALICIVPYLLCWIFSKKHFGWMIGALVLFSLDSAIFLVDFISLITVGDFSMIFDLIIRIWALASLIGGVRYGARLQKEGFAEKATPADAEGFLFSAASAEGGSRQVTVSRKKAFAGCAAELTVFVNGQEVCRLKNGECKSFSAPADRFELGASAGMASTKLSVEAGSLPQAYAATVKLGALSGNVILEKLN